MARIFIKGRREPIEVSNDTAKRVKKNWCGDVSTGAGKAAPNDIVNLGDEWAGEYGSIRCIELDKYIPPPRPEIKEPEVEPTPEEKKRVEEIKKEIGLIVKRCKA